MHSPCPATPKAPRSPRRVLAAALCAMAASVASAEGAPWSPPSASPPGDTPEKFAPGIVSVEGRNEYGLSFSPEGDELLFTAGSRPGGEPAGLRLSRRSAEGTWSPPEPVDLRGLGLHEFEAFHSPEGRLLCFAGEDAEGRARIWLVPRLGSTHGTATLIAGPVNSTDVFWPCLARDGTLYFTDIRSASLYRAAPVDGGYPARERLGFARGVIHSFLSPDGDYMLCDNGRDLLVAFRTAGGGWTFPVNLGPTVNSPRFDEACPSLSPDGAYLFFSRYDGSDGTCDIYRVGTGFIEALRPKP